jgi:NifU-like protein involved in Fe-S cluster formation
VAKGVNQPLYTVEILRLAASIPHLGRLGDPQGSAEVRSPTCGSTVTVEVSLDDQGRVVDLGQQVEACAFGQASAALMGSAAIGRSGEEIDQALADFAGWLDGSRDDPGNWPGLAALAPARARRGRHGAMLLPFRGLLASIRDAEDRPR